MPLIVKKTKKTLLKRYFIFYLINLQKQHYTV